jgi:hypothetical protein
MTAAGLVCGPCGTEFLPNAKSYNQSAVPSYQVGWSGDAGRSPLVRHEPLRVGYRFYG